DAVAPYPRSEIEMRVTPPAALLDSRVAHDHVRRRKGVLRAQIERDRTAIARDERPGSICVVGQHEPTVFRGDLHGKSGRVIAADTSDSRASACGTATVLLDA